ncbi:hypothetical protein BH10PAT4_BH10PAT4_4230 [soil metagenome]
MSSAETVPTEGKTPAPRHLHIVDDIEENNEIPESAEVEVPRLALTQEQRRDKTAIQVFIELRDKLWASGKPLPECIRQAALAYDEVLSRDLENFGPNPTGPKVEEDFKAANQDIKTAIDAGLVDSSDIQFTLPNVKPSDEFITRIKAAKDAEIAKVREWYAGKGTHQDTIDARNAELETIEEKYQLPAEQKAHKVNDNQLYKTYEVLGYDKSYDPPAKRHWGKVENRGLKTLDQISALAPAVAASYEARMAATNEGKSLDEAYDIGAKRYKDVLAEMKIAEGIVRRPYPVLSTEDLHESLAIKDFNDERDMGIPKSRQHGSFERGWALHRAVGKYKERKHLLEHAAHEQHADEQDHPDVPPMPSPTVRRHFGRAGIGASSSNSGEAKEKLTSKERVEDLSKWLRKTGLNALFVTRLVTEKNIVPLAVHAGAHVPGDELLRTFDSFLRKQEEAEERKQARKQNKLKKQDIKKRANHVVELEHRDRIDKITKGLRDYIDARHSEFKP